MADELVVIEDQTPPLTLFGTTEPIEVLDRATKVANALADLLQKKGLYATISGRKYVTVDGWETLGAMLGVFSQIEWARPIEGGWEARAIATAPTGRVIGAGEAQCTRSEATWKTRDDYALRAMAQTRATSRALRGALGFIVKLAGYESTPESEMPANPEFQGARTEAATPGPNSTPSLALAPSRSPAEILNDARKKTPHARYADEDAVCPDCGHKEYLAANGSFCAKAKGGCGWPKGRGEKGTPISYGEYLQRHPA